jgi:hypothetical protein
MGGLFLRFSGDSAHASCGPGRPPSDFDVRRLADESGIAGMADLLDDLTAAGSVRNRARAELPAVPSLVEENAR